jgi:VWFA-related protein
MTHFRSGRAIILRKYRSAPCFQNTVMNCRSCNPVDSVRLLLRIWLCLLSLSALGQDATKLPITLKSTSRLVTVDVVVKDIYGRPLSNLSSKDFQIQEKIGWATRVPEKIASFRVVDSTANQKAEAKHAGSPGISTNSVPTKIPDPSLTILLLDGVNTDLFAPEIRLQVTRMADTFPAHVPIAVLLLGKKLQVLQDFTTDPKLLRSAVRGAFSQGPFKVIQSSDLNTLSLDPPEIQDNPSNLPSLSVVQDWNRSGSSDNFMDRRIQITMDAMRAIVRHLAGYPGRKKLIWVSSALPFSIAPGPQIDSHTELQNYRDQISVLMNALSNARVAVYPAHPGGFEFSTRDATNAVSGPTAAPVPLQSTNYSAADTTMEEFSSQTGGQTCTNDRDLSGCVKKALTDGLNYYEISYNASSENWKAGFRRIRITTPLIETHLSYRRGYYAQSENPGGIQTAGKNTADPELKQAACDDVMTATSIALKVQQLGHEIPAKYSLLVNGNLLNPDFSSDESHQVKLHLDYAVCAFDGAGKPIQYLQQHADRNLTEPQYESAKQNGLPYLLEFAAPQGTTQLRLLVRDSLSGDVGSVDLKYPGILADAATPDQGATSIIFSSADEPRGSAPPLITAESDRSVQSVGLLQEAEISSYCDAMTATGDQGPVLASLCKFVLSLRRRLPNVICEREMKRSGLPNSEDDVVKATATYRDGQEYYSNVSIDGKPTDPSSPALAGMSIGEFATYLQALFAPDSDTDFKFLKEEVGRSGHSLVFTYRVDRQNNQFHYLHATIPGSRSGMTFFPGYRGRLWLDKATLNLIRMESEAVDIDPGFPIRSAKTDVEYTKVSLGDGTEFVLPIRSNIRVCSGDSSPFQDCAHNVEKFTNWHRFGVKTRIVSDVAQ